MTKHAGGPGAQPPKQKIAWHYFKGIIPKDWECTNYNMDPKKGRIQFSSRNGIEATFHWQITKHPIDELRMVTEVHRRHLEREDAKRAPSFNELQQRNRGGFIFAYDIPGQICHATYFIKEHKIHFHWIFPDYSEKKARNVLDPILDTFAANIDDIREWGLFNIYGHLPRDYKPVEIEAVPANVSLIFEGPKHHHIYLRRFGLPDLLLGGGTLFSFYGNYQKKLRRRVTSKRDIMVHGMSGLELEIEQRGEYAMEKLAGRWWRGTASIWLNTEEQRMYCFEQIGPKSAKPLEITDVIQA